MHPVSWKTMTLSVTLFFGTPLSVAPQFLNSQPSNHELHLAVSSSAEQTKGWLQMMSLISRHVLSYTKRDLPTNPGFNYGKDKIRGVNIGGWLVTEPWITPSLYDTWNDKIIDEYTFCQYLGREEATRRLRIHWDTFYTQQDFETIKSYGLNHIRVPIGYWAFDISAGEPYVQGQFEYLLKAVEWARGADLKVMIDLHGAPGSQNGFDNSGQKGPINWATDVANVDRTKNVLAILAKEFTQAKYAGTVTSLEALNEPAGFTNDSQKLLNTTRQYYYDGYGIVRYPDGPSQSDLLYVIHDAFQPLETWSKSFPPPKWQGVALDTHSYTVFDTNTLAMNDQDRVTYYCGLGEKLAASYSSLWTFVGEFAPAPTDCAPRLNGQGIGARYDGTFETSVRLGSCMGKSGSSASFSPEYKDSLARFFEVQTTVYERASGWIMWTFKAENSDDWSYDQGVKGGWIPRDPGFKPHGSLCG